MSDYPSKLPKDLKLEVAHHLDTKALSCLVLVSAVFHAVFESCLYKTVDITSKYPHSHVLTLFETNRKYPYIGEYIKTLKINHLREESGKTQELIQVGKQEAHLSAGAILEQP
ncbi:hypothetical protein AJ80_09693 [Polytolypa hystricis UAMH7299]|uniref:F-box domain-containing protein n=1 Tax=Polytolypa hystricis (strain UAMH7299) TaxID=1447883 RepID=A0A2B7WLJ1_POLH7|nr:hypothetical protein AJ80_09693 [Polytolypa hystricis UAMH7299]